MREVTVEGSRGLRAAIVVTAAGLATMVAALFFRTAEQAVRSQRQELPSRRCDR